MERSIRNVLWETKLLAVGRPYGPSGGCVSVLAAGSASAKLRVGLRIFFTIYC